MRTTKRHNKDGSTVEYYQLAETRWDPTQRRPTAHIIHNFGRADTLDRAALLRLAQSISRVCQGGLDVPPEVSPPGEAIDIEWARPLGVVHVARALWEALGIGEVLRGLEPQGPRRAPHDPSLRCIGTFGHGTPVLTAFPFRKSSKYIDTCIEEYALT